MTATAGVPWRVAYVIGELGKGGAEYQLYELLRGLDRRRFRAEVFVLTAGTYWAAPIRELGIPVHELVGRGSADVGRLRRLRAALRAFGPHVLHTILWSGNSYGRLASIGLGVPVVITAERNVIARPGWQVAVERFLDRWTDLYLVNSRAVAQGLVGRERLPATKMRVVHNGIDLERVPAFALDRQAARRTAGFDPARRLVAQVGRLEPQKDYPTFLAAAARVLGEVTDVDVLVAGEGALRPDLEALASRLGIASRVRFLGLRHDVPALLGGVDVLALTSLYEGLPNVVIEAMATGAVAVATDVGGCRELIVPGETGFLVPPGDAEAVAGAILRVLRAPDAAHRLASAARRRVESEFTVEAMVEKTMAAYDGSLSQKGLGGSGAVAAA
jgi:glycosyltransferase involved in cell wall biosynthesis